MWRAFGGAIVESLLGVVLYEYLVHLGLEFGHQAPYCVSSSKFLNEKTPLSSEQIQQRRDAPLP